MSAWGRTRDEVAGAWRSLRYDMGRRTGEPAPDDRERPDRAADVTSTGMSTFGGTVGADLCAGYDEPARPPRRLVAIAAFVTLSLVGAAGSYFAVGNGLGALLQEKRSAAERYPLAAAAPAGDGEAAASTSGMGRGPAAASAETTAALVPPRSAVTRTTTTPAAVRRAQRTIRPMTPRGEPTLQDCDCLTPPVPTPTAPASPSPTPSTDAGPSPSAGASESSPADDPSPEPSASGGPDGSRLPGRP